MEIGRSRLLPFTSRLSRVPWWALAALLIGVLFAWVIATDENYSKVFNYVSDGVQVTILVTGFAFIGAVLLGMVVALMRISHSVVLYQVSTFYVNIVRGLPMLTILMYVYFVVIPAAMQGVNILGIRLLQLDLLYVYKFPETFVNFRLIRINAFSNIADALANFQISDVTIQVSIALMIAYSAFIAEIFRAGIESVDRGQMEAARALGMTYWQAMRHVILRQAVRIVIPPLGNDFIAMLKDSSLVSVLGVHDITLNGKLYAASTYLVFPTYNVMAYLYLVMTLLLSMVVKWIEQLMSRERGSR